MESISQTEASETGGESEKRKYIYDSRRSRRFLRKSKNYVARYVLIYGQKCIEIAFKVIAIE